MYLVHKKFRPLLFLIDIIGYIIFFWVVFRKRPKRIKKVLFIRLEHIGDMVVATPVFENFKKSHPECEVHVLCRNLTKPMILHNPFVDSVITYDAPWFLQRSGDKKQSIFGLIRLLRREKYDIVFEMHGDPRNNMMAFLMGGYGRGYGCRGLGFLLSETTRYNPTRHMILQNLELIKPFCTITTSQTQIFTDETSKEEASRLMKEYGLQKGKFVIISPKSGRKDKDLVPSEIIEFIRSHKGKIVFTGSGGERQFCELFVDSSRVINLCGKMSLLGLTEIVRNSREVIACDTGIVHIAHAARVPCKVVYKTTDRGVWGY